MFSRVRPEGEEQILYGVEEIVLDSRAGLMTGTAGAEWCPAVPFGSSQIAYSHQAMDDPEREVTRVAMRTLLHYPTPFACELQV